MWEVDPETRSKVCVSRTLTVDILPFGRILDQSLTRIVLTPFPILATSNPEESRQQ
jgi:hypothetical protein